MRDTRGLTRGSDEQDDASPRAQSVLLVGYHHEDVPRESADRRFRTGVARGRRQPHLRRGTFVDRPRGSRPSGLRERDVRTGVVCALTHCARRVVLVVAARLGLAWATVRELEDDMSVGSDAQDVAVCECDSSELEQQAKPREILERAAIHPRSMQVACRRPGTQRSIDLAVAKLYTTASTRDNSGRRQRFSRALRPLEPSTCP